jgi:DNA-binding MarR family transcriptional regulator
MIKGEFQFSAQGIEGKMFSLWERVQRLRLGELPLHRVDLSVSQMQVLRFVGRNPGCHLQDVADAVELTSPTVSVSMRWLEEQGYIERQTDPADKRAACFYLTEVSQAALQQMLKTALKGMKRFLSELSVEEQDQLVHLLDKAVTGMENSLQKQEKS